MADISCVNGSPSKIKLEVGMNLMTPLQGPKSSAKGQPLLRNAEDWCKFERSRLGTIGLVDVEDGEVQLCIEILHRELQSLFVLALQHDMYEVWTYFVKVLKLLEPIKLHVQSLPECQHYIERFSDHCESNKDKLAGLEIMEALLEVFPQHVKLVREENSKPKHQYCTPVPPTQSLTSEPRRSVKYKLRPSQRSILLPDGTNPYLLDRPGEEDKFDPVNTSLTFGDLRKSIAAVGVEAAQRESIWNTSAGFLMKAFDADLPEDPKLIPRTRQSRLPKIDEETQAKTIMDEAMRASSQAAGNILDTPEGVMTAREAIAYFARLYHLGKIKHLYFNIVDQTRWSPYDLIAVPRQKINSDHYVFSTFGVLSVSKHQPCEVLSLGEWFRQAVIHKAISRIPFFKNYLIRRCFYGWLAVRRRAEYEKRRGELQLTILRGVSNYNSAFLSVAKLLQELATISFLPLQTNVCYTIGNWKNVLNYRNLQSEKFLERFYMYCRNLIEHARKEQFEKLAFCEKQVGNKAVLSRYSSTKESLHLSNKKQKAREDNLKQCRAETNRLGNFVKMVDQLILAQLIHIIKMSVNSFVYSTLQNVPGECREAMFKCSLQFNSEGVLDIAPSRDEYTKVIKGAIHDLPHVLCDVSYGIDADYLVNERVATMRPETRYTAIGTTTKQKSTGAVSLPKPSSNQKHVRLTVAELKSHTARNEDEEGPMNTPERSRTKFPSKAEEDLLIRTPELAVPMSEEMELVGRGYAGRYAPLTSTNVSQLLLDDTKHQAVVAEGEAVLDSAFDEVEAFVQENIWFNDIYEFCKTWNVVTKLSWKRAQAFHIEDYNPREQASIIEQQLTTIRTWIERIKNFEKSFLSSNQLVLVDCTYLHDTMVPRLNDIYKDIIEFVAEQTIQLANDFVRDMKEIVQNMKEKKSDIAGFAKYAQQVFKYKKNTAAYQQEVEYIKSLFEVVRMSYRQLSAAEEKLEGQVMQQWELFLSQMQDASEFINTQTPIMMKSLEQSHESLIAEAERLGEVATTGKFLDPSQDPTAMLIEMRHIRDQFYSVRKKLLQASKWREAISGEGYELEFLQEIGDSMDIRQELWKYVEVSSHAIKDWRAQLFKKMHAQKALDKVTEWLSVATHMQGYLPSGDKVLAYWFSSLENFKKDLPLLHKMSSDALKPTHWKAIFVGMGEKFQLDWEFTVEELLSYNLAAHHNLIETIFSRAQSEYRLEQKLLKIQRLWTSNDVYFKLAKHIPDSVYTADKSRMELRRGGEKNRAPSRQTPIASPPKAPKGLDTSFEDLYILIETDELQYLLEDSQVSLKQMLASPYISGFRSDTENLDNKIREVEELLQLWMNCQSKWLYLIKLFEDPKLYLKMAAQAFAFEGVHTQMKDIQKSVLADPGVMSITTHIRGEKGFKTIQGDNLRRMFTDMIRVQEEILKELSFCIEKLRVSFPRLYFVTDNDVISMMSVIRSPQHFIPIAKKCFPSIETMRFELPSDFQNSANIALDYQLNGDKLETVNVFGEHGESITLLERVKAFHDGPTWLSHLEKQLKLTMVSQLQNCLLEYLDNDDTDFLSVLEEISQTAEERYQKEHLEHLKHSVSLPIHLTIEATTWNNRLLKFPLQCLVAVEKILWSHRVGQALKSTNTTQHKMAVLRDALQEKLDQVSRVIRENSSLLYTRIDGARVRLCVVLKELVQCYMHLITTTNRLLASNVSCMNCFDWSSVLRYSIDISPILRAKTFVQTSEEKLDPCYQRERSLRLSSDPSRMRTPLTPLSRRNLSHASGGGVQYRVTFSMTGEEMLEKQKTSVEVISTYTFGTLQLKQLDASYRYDYEYHGAKATQTSTPLTERAQHSLMMALKDYQVGTLIGPSCTGKTETVLSFSQMLGTCVFPVTCSSELSLSHLQRVFSGIVQSGCWAMFDNTDRVTVELMSVAGQQLHLITQSLRTLRYSLAYEYTARGFPTTEQQYLSMSKQKPKRAVRRNSLTTLHSLKREDDYKETPKFLTRVNTFIPSREGRVATHHGEPERRRRHSIDRENSFKNGELYVDDPPPSLFYEKVVYPKNMAADKLPVDTRHMISDSVTYDPCYLGSITYSGRLIPARDTAACFMLFNSNSPRTQEIPQSLKLRMRPTAMIKPDRAVIVSTYLYSWGYPNSQAITEKLLNFITFCETQLPSLRISLKTLLHILQLAVERFYNPALSPEFKEDKEPSSEAGFSLPKPDKYEESVVFGLTTILQPQFESTEQTDIFKDIIRDVFPLCSDLSPSRQDAELVAAIKEQLRTDGLQQSPALIEKILQLNNALQQSTGVIISGPAGSGKTVLYKTLCLVLNKLHSKKAAAAAAAPMAASTAEEIQPSKPLASLRHNVPKASNMSEQPSVPLISAPPITSSVHSALTPPLEVNDNLKITPLTSAAVSLQSSSYALDLNQTSLHAVDITQKLSQHLDIEQMMSNTTSMTPSIFKLPTTPRPSATRSSAILLNRDSLQHSVEMLKTMEARETSELLKKWGNMSRSFARVGSLHKLIIDSAPAIVYPKVDMMSLCPSAMTTSELFGESVDGLWRDGTLTRLLQGVNRHVTSAQTFTQLYKTGRSESMLMTHDKKTKNGIEQPSVIDNWLVLDGDVYPVWVDNLSSMVDSNNRFTLANGETIQNTNFTSLIFETGSLQDASPSSIARCSVVHCSHDLTHWKSLTSSWMLQARHKWILNTSRLKTLDHMITELFEPTLKFIDSELNMALDDHLSERHGSYRNSVRGIHEVQTFLRIITALLDKYMLRDGASAGETSFAAGMSSGEGGLSESQSSGAVRSSAASSAAKSVLDEDYEAHENMLKCIFVYSYIWGFGGQLSDSSRLNFDQYAKEALYRCSNSVTLPRTGSVYDLFVDVKEATLSKWQDKPPERLRSIPANYALTSDIERVYHITDLLISSNNHVLLTGASGVGKTALVSNMLMTRQHFTKIAMCPGLSSAQFQKIVITRLQDLRQKTLFSLGPQGGGVKPPQRHLFFIDDLSTASPTSGDNYTQPCLEALREMMSHSVTYDRQRHVFEDSKPATFLAACTTPGYAGSGFGVNAHSPSDRLIRQMSVINFFSLTDDGMHSLYGRTLQTWLEEFPSYAVEHHYEFAKAMMQGILDMYKLMRDKFRATPAHGHYVFTLHDIGHVVEGMLLLSPRKTKSKPRRARAKKDNATTASNVQSLFGGMLPGGKVSKDKFRSLSVKDSKDTKNQSADAALPMMPVLVRLWCHELSRTFADRLLYEDDENWFKKTLRDLVEKHFCTASPDWLDTHAASRHMRAVLEDKTFERTNKGAMKGTPLPFGHALGENADSDDSDLSDGSMTEVTADVVTPFSEADMDPDSYMQAHGPQAMKDDVPSRRNKFADYTAEESEDEMEADQGAITPFTETTVNLPDLPLTPEQDDEKPTFDHYNQSDGQMYLMYGNRMPQQNVSSSEESESTGNRATATSATTDPATSAVPTTVAGDGASGLAVSISDDMTNFTSLTPVTWETRSIFTVESRRTSASRAISDLTSDTTSVRRQPLNSQISAANLAALQQVNAQRSGAGGGVIRKRRSIARRTDSKRGVTFKMGLIADKEVQEEYKGALMNFDEIRSVSSEDLSEIMFSKFYISAYADYVGMSSERGYSQYTESQIEEALDACLHIYNQHTLGRLRLVFFREAVRHATRISRILSFTGAHALLLGLPHSAGRTTLIRLASHISHSKLFEVKPLETNEKTLSDFKAKVIQGSHMAGVNGRASILYVHSGVPESVLRDLCCLMSEGRCPDLYSDIDMQNMATAMTPGQVQTKRLDKIEVSFERYLKKVRQNMHIIVSLDISASESLETFELLRRYPQLITKSMHIDCYKPWSFDTYQYVAKKWLTSPQRSTEKVQWDRGLYADQLTCISRAMAYVHKTSEEAIVQLHCHNDIPAHRVYSPLTFQEFHHLFNHIAASIHKKAEGHVKLLKQVLDKVNEAFGTIRNLEAQANLLEPKLDLSVTNVKELREKVEEWRQKYITALQVSKDSEARLEELKKPLAELRGEADAEFDKISPATNHPPRAALYKSQDTSLSSAMRLSHKLDSAPKSKPSFIDGSQYLTLTNFTSAPSHTKSSKRVEFDLQEPKALSPPAENPALSASQLHSVRQVNATYYAAMAAINSLNQSDLEELKSYRKPPKSIHIVGEALCIMFNQASTDWEAAQQLMFGKNFFQDMEFYDKSHLSPKVFSTLSHFCNTPEFQPELVQMGSQAAAAICQWIHSVYKYAEIYKQIAPKLARLMEAEADVTKAQAELGQKRIHASKTKKELEDLIAQHKEASAKARQLEQQYQAMKKRITESKEVLNNMDLHIKIWRSELVEAEKHIACAPGDAMLIAAICCYQGPIDSHTRERLTNDWRERCLSNRFHNATVSLEPKPVTVKSTGHISDIPSANDMMRRILHSSDSTEEGGLSAKTSRRPIIIRDDFSLESILSDFTEVSSWVRGGMGHDLHKLHSTLMLRTCAKNHTNYWPVLIDPESHAESLLRTISKQKSAADLSADTTSELSSEEGDSLLVSHTPPLPPIPSSGDAPTLSVGGDTSETDSHSVISQSAPSHSTRNPPLSVRRSSSSELAPVQVLRQSSQGDKSDIDRLYTADRNIERPADNLWVIQATDPLLAKYIVNAVVHGVGILVTHTERKSLPEALVDVLYKNFEKGEGESSKPVVKVREFLYPVHRNFRLYMSINTSLLVKGDDTRRVPFGHCNLIDLSLSQQAHIDALLDDIMKVEKAEHEAQARSIEGGILHHKQELNAEQWLVQNKLVSNEKTILDDSTMLSTLQQCRQNIIRNAQILEETLYLSNQLSQKRESYMEVALNAAMMYDVICHMGVLSPYYCLSFERFQSLCRSTVQSRYRGKGVTGAPKARCQELINAITEQVFKLMGCILFEDHWQVFALLVTIQRMNSAQSFTQEELFNFVNDVKHVKFMLSVNSKERPHWIEHESWISCHKLEVVLPCFNGLVDSLSSRSKEWMEYFTSSMSVVNLLPGETLSLTLFQKCILWRIVRPNRFSEVCHNLLLTELGPTIMQSQPFTPEHLLSAEIQSRPVVFIEPPPTLDTQTEPGFPSRDPCELVRSLLPENALTHRVTVLTFGEGITMADVEKALHYSMEHGLWLILQNCHLAPYWSDSVLQIFKRVLEIKEVVYEKEEGRNRLVPVIPYEQLNPGINPKFRLWFTTQYSQTQAGRLLPGCIIWQSTKYVLEQRRSYRHQLSSVYKYTLSKVDDSRETNTTVKLLTSELLLPLTILHCQLLHRRRYAQAAYRVAPQWSIKELNTVLSAMQAVFNSCDGAEKFTDLVISVYKPHCVTEEDGEAVEAMIRNVLRTRAELDQSEVELNARGSQALLATLLDDSADSIDSADVIHRINCLLTENSSVLSLTESADSYLRLLRSRKLMKTLSRISGHPDVAGITSMHAEVFEGIDILLSGWESVLHGLPELSYTPDDELNPMQKFLHKQVFKYKRLVEVLLKDSELLHGIARTEFSCDDQCLEMIYQLFMGKVPHKWRKLLSGSGATLMQWKADLELASNLLIKYIDKESKVIAYNLSAFIDPGLFLEALLIEHSRTHYQDINDLELHTEFLSMGYRPPSAPEAGCYITGLTVHNALWDTSKSTIKVLDAHDMPLVNELPILHIVPRVRNQSTAADTRSVYQCPLVCSELGLQDPLRKHVINLKIIVGSERESRDLTERQVFISSSLKEKPF